MFFEVIDFCTNRKCVCNFLLVIYSNLIPVLPRFRDIADYLLKTAPTPIPLEFWGVLLGLDCHSMNLRLRRADNKITFELTHAIYTPTVHQPHRRTDDLR